MHAVTNVLSFPAGKFAFVEFRTEEIAHLGMQLDKTELNGRGLKIGRPNGYVEPAARLGVAASVSEGGMLFHFGQGSGKMRLASCVLCSILM